MRRRAFSFVDMLVVLLVLGLVVAILLPAVGRRTHCGRDVKDSTQVKNILVAMTTWAQSNKGQYPRPSRLDPNNATIAEPPGSGASSEKQFQKDTTGNILSILIWNGQITPEMSVSPAEASSMVKADDEYKNSRPKAAADPGNAQWDPGFAGTPLDAIVGRKQAVSNNSYAHAMLVGARGARWSSTFKADEAIFGNRGPTYQGIDEADAAVRPKAGWSLNPEGQKPGPGVGSNTLLVHGGRATWEGNIGYNDNHVTFETKPDPDGLTYQLANAASPQRIADNLFVDESDDASGASDRPAAQSGVDRFQRNMNQYLRPIAQVSGASASTIAPGSGLTVWRD